MKSINRGSVQLQNLPSLSAIWGYMTHPSRIHLTAAGAFGTLLGLLALINSPGLVLVGLIGLILLVMTFKAPEYVILVDLSLASDLIPESINPSLNILVGHAQVSDLILLWLLFVVILRIFIDKSISFVRTPLNLPIFIFFCTVLVGLMNSVVRFGVDFSNATVEARILLYYLIFFAVTNLIRTRSQLIRLGQGILVIGLLIGIVMIGQSGLIGLIPEGEEGLIYGQGVARVFNPGFPVVYMVLLIQISYMALNRDERRSLFSWLQVLVMSAAMFVTVTRNVAVTLAIGFILLLTIIPRVGRTRLARNILIISLIVIGLVSLLVILGMASEVIDYSRSFYERIASMFSSNIFERSENLYPRWKEIQYAWTQIKKNPILGIGLYNPYRPSFDPYESPFLRLFIHNAFLGLWLKTGLLGLVSFLWFSLGFIIRGLRTWRNVKHEFLRSLLLGSTIGYAGIMISNLVAPSLIESSSLIIFGILLGLSELIILNSKQFSQQEAMEKSHRHSFSPTQ